MSNWPCLQEPWYAARALVMALYLPVASDSQVVALSVYVFRFSGIAEDIPSPLPMITEVVGVSAVVAGAAGAAGLSGFFS